MARDSFVAGLSGGTGGKRPRGGRAGRSRRGASRSESILILEGESPLATSLGFRPTANRVSVRGVEVFRAPKLAIVWEEAADLPVFEIPKEARVFARERWLRAAHGRIQTRWGRGVVDRRAAGSSRL